MARNKERVRKADAIVEMTPDHVREFARCAHDIVYFCRKYVKIQHPIRGSVPFDLYPYQIKMLRAYQEHRYTIVLSARQTGKEQPHTAKIAIPTGWTTMGDIRPGDIVLTPDGKQVSVLEKHPQGIKDVYKITFDDGSSAECGIDHLWTCYIRNKWDSSAANGHGGYVVEKQNRTTKELIDHFEKNRTRKNNTNYNIRIPTVDVVNFIEKDLPLDPYVLGLLLGDGCLSIPYTTMFTTKDNELVTSLNERINQHECVAQLVEGSSGFDYRINSTNGKNKINNIIKDLNLSGTKSDTKFIPECYKTGSPQQRLSLLQGLMDTDGTVSKRNGSRTISYCTTSIKLRDDVQQLVWSLGGRCSYYTRTPQDPNNKLAYELYISLPEPKDCFKLQRKRDLCHVVWKNKIGHETEIRRTVVNIEKVREEESSCITIDHPDHLYITDNYTVTHNSITSAIYLLWHALFNKDQKILIASNKNAGAMEMIARIKHAYEELPMWLKPGVKDDGYNKHAIHFDNGSQIDSVATSEDSARGKSVSLLFLDEFAFVKPGIQTEFWSAVLPTLSTGGSCIMTSTPNGDENLFAQMWRSAETGRSMNASLIKENDKDKYQDITFFPIQVRWDEPPGRDEAFKAQQISQLGELLWRQEYECLAGDTIVTLKQSNGVIFDMSIRDLFNQLSESD